jgi:hypothetical protein
LLIGERRQAVLEFQTSSPVKPSSKTATAGSFQPQTEEPALFDFGLDRFIQGGNDPEVVKKLGCSRERAPSRSLLVW